MAYLQDFENDVFISYCHDDNEVAEGGKGWVDRFAEQLKLALKQESGQRGKIAVWQDPQLSRAEVFDKVIERTVGGSGVMLVLLSPAYQNSPYCKQEIAWFREQAERRKSGLEVGDYRRLLPVLLRDIPPDEWPEAGKGTLGYKFHWSEGDEAGWPLDPDAREFRKELRHLVKDLWGLLQELGGGEAAAAPESGEEEDAQPFRVFLSSPPVDLKPTREQIREALEGKGIELLPDIPPPEDAAAHADAVQKAVAEADLSIHLLGLHPGKALPQGGPALTYPVEQARIGLEHSRSQLVLMPDHFDVDFLEDEAYAEFIRSLGERQRDAGTLEVVKTGRHQMLDEILAKRRKLLEAARRAGADAGAAAFIDLHPKDWSRAGDLVAYLEEKEVPWRMERSAEPSRFAEALKRTRLFLVVFGEVARDWVVARINNALQLQVEENLHFSLAVYLATHHARKESGFGGAIQVVDSADRFDADGLDLLLQSATGGTA